MSIDLHALANEPGYGAARDALAKAGLWDEYAGKEPRQFRVKITAVQHIEEEYFIEARDPKEAEKLARDEARDEYDEIYGVEVQP